MASSEKPALAPIDYAQDAPLWVRLAPPPCVAWCPIFMGSAVTKRLDRSFGAAGSVRRGLGCSENLSVFGPGDRPKTGGRGGWPPGRRSRKSSSTRGPTARRVATPVASHRSHPRHASIFMRSGTPSEEHDHSFG